MRVSACKCCGESINAGERGPLPEKCGPCMGRKRFNGPPLPKRGRPLKRPEDRIRSDRFTFVEGRVQSACGTCGRVLWLGTKCAASSTRHFCGAECRSIGSRHAVPHLYECIRCGKQCSMKGSPRQKQKGVYCSRKCAASTRGEKKSAEHSAVVPWRDLGEWFHAWGQRDEDSRIVAIERFLFPPHRRLHRIKLLRRCVDCGCIVGKHRRRCCDCVSLKKRRSYRKSGNLRSRCKRFGVEYDSRVNRLSVCDRDGWICAICGVKTIKEVNRKNPSPLEGTLDHIVPLSRRTKGNTWDNAQCACRRCNCQKKRDRLLCCQMRLF